jgi:mannose-6-phosphate isomerase-like protein (cupin superfamily)
MVTIPPSVASSLVHYIPKGVDHFVYNLSKTERLEAIGIHIGTGSVEETG